MSSSTTDTNSESNLNERRESLHIASLLLHNLNVQNPDVHELLTITNDTLLKYIGDYFHLSSCVNDKGFIINYGSDRCYTYRLFTIELSYHKSRLNRRDEPLIITFKLFSHCTYDIDEINEGKNIQNDSDFIKLLNGYGDDYLLGFFKDKSPDTIVSYNIENVFYDHVIENNAAVVHYKYENKNDAYVLCLVKLLYKVKNLFEPFICADIPQVTCPPLMRKILFHKKYTLKGSPDTHVW